MTQFLSTVAFMGQILGIKNEERTLLCRPWFDYYRRGLLTYQDPNRWTSLWPCASRFLNGDNSVPLAYLGNDQFSTGPFESPSPGVGGNAAQKFIMGQCQDGGGTPLGGALVRAYVANTGELAGETTTNDQGNYEVGCKNSPTSMHFIAAYYEGGPDLAGCSVNTLIPTNRDGT